MPSQLPCIGVLPALPLDKNLELGNWIIGTPPKDVPWRSSAFKGLVDRLLTSFENDGFKGGSLLWHRTRGFDGIPPADDELAAIRGAAGFAALDYNDCLEGDLNKGHHLVTTENAALYVQPIDEQNEGIALLSGGMLKRVTSGGWKIGQKAPPLPDAVVKVLGTVRPSRILANAIFTAFRAPESETLRRLRIAVEWHGAAMSNPMAVTLQQRLIGLKTGFEALLRTSSSWACAKRLRRLFEKATQSHRELLPSVHILWSPAERTDLVREWVKDGEKKRGVRSELEDWFMTLAEARNAIIHEGKLSTVTYEAPPERPLSRYAGQLFWVGERLLREAVKAVLGPEVLLCGPLQRRAAFAPMFEQFRALLADAGSYRKTSANEEAAEASPIRGIAELLHALGCSAANQVQIRRAWGGRSSSEDVARANARQGWAAEVSGRSIAINDGERALLLKAGAEEELPDLYMLCD